MRYDVRRTPGFTAAAALQPASRRYRRTPAPDAGAADLSAIVPSMLPRVQLLSATPRDYGMTMTCSGRDAARCTATCDALGGGMMSDATGTVSCHIY